MFTCRSGTEELQASTLAMRVHVCEAMSSGVHSVLLCHMDTLDRQAKRFCHSASPSPASAIILPPPPRPNPPSAFPALALRLPSPPHLRTNLQPRHRPGAHISRPCCTPGLITQALVYRPGCPHDGNSPCRPNSSLACWNQSEGVTFLPGRRQDLARSV